MEHHDLSGVWRVSGFGIDVFVHLPPNSSAWLYDSDSEILCLGRDRAPDKRYLVRWFSRNEIMLVGTSDHRVTFLCRPAA